MAIIYFVCLFDRDREYIDIFVLDMEHSKPHDWLQKQPAMFQHGGVDNFELGRNGMIFYVNDFWWKYQRL